MTPYLGEIRMFAGSAVPFGWLACDGSLLSISEYGELYGLIGGIYGGDTKTTFALPDLRGVAPIGIGQGLGLSPYFLGERAGESYVFLEEAHLPFHNHFLHASTGTANTTSPEGARFGSVEGVTVQDGNTTTPLALYQDPPTSPRVSLGAATISEVGGQAHSNLMPSFSVTFMISTSGTFPAPA